MNSWQTVESLGNAVSGASQLLALLTGLEDTEGKRFRTYLRTVVASLHLAVPIQTPIMRFMECNKRRVLTKFT